MKKILGIALLCSLMAVFTCYALDNQLVSMRQKFFQESKNIQQAIKNSRDIVALTSMWDSCFIAMTQLDAYFSMIGLFETIEKASRTPASLNYLIDWLSKIKQTNGSNIRSLDSVQGDLDKSTGVLVKKMKISLSDFNRMIDSEMARLVTLREGISRKAQQ